MRIIYVPKPVGVYPVKYGLLYNWWAVTDARDIVALGWTIPTFNELFALRNYVGGSASGGKLKEANLTYWNSPNTGATNDYVFNARGSSSRNSTTGAFGAIKTSSNIWAGIVNAPAVTSSLTLSSSSSNINFTTTTDNISKNSGYSIRAIRPATTAELALPDGEISAKYIGNDGKIYRCTKIGTLIWMADNLAETKFRNGDWITGFDGGTYTTISNANWIAKTTEACCAHTNNTSNI